jgi:hypothetical protein
MQRLKGKENITPQRHRDTEGEEGVVSKAVLAYFCGIFF